MLFTLEEDISQTTETNHGQCSFGDLEGDYLGCNRGTNIGAHDDTNSLSELKQASGNESDYQDCSD